MDVADPSIRWATDYIPLASSGSRLASTSALLFATWSDEGRKGKGTGGQLLAIATKNNVLLYETPKGERAYKFVKVCCSTESMSYTLISPNRNSILPFSLELSLSFKWPYRILPREVILKAFQDYLIRTDELIAGVRCGVSSIVRLHKAHCPTALISVFSLPLIKGLCGFV